MTPISPTFPLLSKIHLSPLPLLPSLPPSLPPSLLHHRRIKQLFRWHYGAVELFGMGIFKLQEGRFPSMWHRIYVWEVRLCPPSLPPSLLPLPPIVSISSRPSKCPYFSHPSPKPYPLTHPSLPPSLPPGLHLLLPSHFRADLLDDAHLVLLHLVPSLHHLQGGVHRVSPPSLPPSLPPFLPRFFPCDLSYRARFIELVILTPISPYFPHFPKTHLTHHPSLPPSLPP